MEGAVWKVIRIGVNKNHTLIVVNLGNNPCSPEDAYSLANVMASPAKAEHPLKHVDLENIYFKKRVLPVSIC